MRTLLISCLVMLTAGCGGFGNSRSSTFVAIPVPDDVRFVIYTLETASGRRTWRLNNDNLQIRLTTNARNGQLIGSQTKKLKPNDYNWVVYNLEQSNFTKVKSVNGPRNSQGNETLTVITQAKSYSFIQNHTIRFPNGFQKVVNVIPGFVNSR
ncbi:MAG: hypothetical protein ACPG47_02985 [Leucothrix sp.]